MFTRHSRSLLSHLFARSSWAGCVTLIAWGCDDAATADTKSSTENTTESTRDAQASSFESQTRDSKDLPSNTDAQGISSRDNAPADAALGPRDDGASPNEATDETLVDAPVDSAPDPTGDAAPNQTSDAIDGGRELTPLEHAQTAYRDWQPRTEQPVPISAEIFSLCRAPSAAENAFVESVHGDNLALQDWLDEGARAGLALFANNTAADGEAPSFPVGATIVKEKLAYREGELQVFALGIMLKREPGFNATNGDWQFGYWEEASGMLSGASEQTYCGQCHALAGTDFVYVDDSWRQPTP